MTCSFNRERDDAERADVADDLGEDRAIVQSVEHPDLSEIEQLKAAQRVAEEKRNLVHALCVKCTYPEDWTIQGDTACLSSAGAERIAMTIGGFAFGERRPATRRAYEDKHGQAYSWTYYLRVAWRNSHADVEGTYGTRDPFLGKADGRWRDQADINEGDIMSAAFHTARGEAIKSLLGLRGLPASRMSDFGMAPEVLKQVKREAKRREREPAVSQNDSRLQTHLGYMLIELAGGDIELAKSLCAEISAFTGRDGKEVPGIASAKGLRGKRLQVTYGKVKERYDDWKAKSEANDGRENGKSV